MDLQQLSDDQLVYINMRLCVCGFAHLQQGTFLTVQLRYLNWCQFFVLTCECLFTNFQHKFYSIFPKTRKLLAQFIFVSCACHHLRHGWYLCNTRKLVGSCLNAILVKDISQWATGCYYVLNWINTHHPDFLMSHGVSGTMEISH